MAINRNHFRESFDEFPAWRCSSCAGGTLTVVPDTLKEREEPFSEKEHKNENWDIDWYIGTFSAVLNCNACGRSTVIAGKSTVEEDYDQDLGRYRGTFYSPRTFTRPPAIFSVSDNLPDLVRDQLIKAFGHFWIDPDACGSAIRRCVEAMLAVAKVKRTSITKGKRQIIALHNRIEQHTKGRLLEAKKYLIAIKWVGNDTTHFNAQAKTKAELLDAFELLQSVFQVVYDDRSRELDKLAKTITKRKGKSPKPRRRKAR